MSRQGRIVRALSGFYTVACEGELIECRGRGALRNQGVTPLVGDEVVVTQGEGLAAVEEILPR